MRSLGLGHFTFPDQPPVNPVPLARGAGFGFVGLRFHPFAPGQLHDMPNRALRLFRAMRPLLT